MVRGIYFYVVDEEFLHNIDIEKLKKEVGLDIDGIGSLASLRNPKGVYKWAKSKENDGTRPQFNAIVKLLEKGATVETLFGVDYKHRVFDDPEFNKGLDLANKPMTKDDVLSLLKELKKKGDL